MIYWEVEELLKTLDVTLSLDWDGSLVAEVPDHLSSSDLRRAIADKANYLTDRMERMRRSATQQYVGGPFNGKHHGLYHRKEFRGYSLRRRHWAVYWFCDDGRALFRGYATSKKKARKGELAQVATKTS